MAAELLEGLARQGFTQAAEGGGIRARRAGRLPERLWQPTDSRKPSCPSHLAARASSYLPRGPTNPTKPTRGAGIVIRANNVRFLRGRWPALRSPVPQAQTPAAVRMGPCPRLLAR
jgi:hypothetical protein